MGSNQFLDYFASFYLIYTLTLFYSNDFGHDKIMGTENLYLEHCLFRCLRDAAKATSVVCDMKRECVIFDAMFQG